MPPPLSMDLRNRIIAAYEAGEGSLRGLAKRFDVGPATTNRLWSRYKKTQEIEPRVSDGGNKPKLDERDLEAIERLVAKQPDITLLDLVEEFVEGGGTRVSKSTMSRAVLHRVKLTRKKTIQGSRRSRRRN